jgi:hypothetical protein
MARIGIFMRISEFTESVNKATANGLGRGLNSIKDENPVNDGKNR